MSKKKKANQSALPKRLFVRRCTKQKVPTVVTASDFTDFYTYEELNRLHGGLGDVGEYVLVDRGTTRVVLDSEQKE